MTWTLSPLPKAWLPSRSTPVLIYASKTKGSSHSLHCKLTNKGLHVNARRLVARPEITLSIAAETVQSTLPLSHCMYNQEIHDDQSWKPTNCGLTVMMPCKPHSGFGRPMPTRRPRGHNAGPDLEVGCGTGKNTQWLRESGSVVGLDFSNRC